MNWFAKTRQEWISESLKVYGFINRGHLVRKFGVSTVQASADLQTFMRDRAGEMAYAPGTKRYETTDALCVPLGGESALAAAEQAPSCGTVTHGE